MVEDENLRIVHQDLWSTVQELRAQRKKSWPGGKGQRGFSSHQQSRQAHFPKHLLAGAMTSAVCGGSIVQISGKAGGYYGCCNANKAVCTNKIIVRRELTEDLLIGEVRDRLLDADVISDVLARVEREVARLRADVPGDLKLKELELIEQQRQVDNMVLAIARGRDSAALGRALQAAERSVEALEGELDGLRLLSEQVFKVPPKPWVEERMKDLRSVLTRRTAKSALLLRKVLGPARRLT